jgi:dihydroorotase-like cyclic amidohydrolase
LNAARAAAAGGIPHFFNMVSTQPPSDMSKVSHGELDAMIQAQQKLLDNIENLEKQAPRNMSFTARAARAFSNNKAGAGVLVMLASCTVMSLNMLSNKREYQARPLPPRLDAGRRSLDAGRDLSAEFHLVR